MPWRKATTLSTIQAKDLVAVEIDGIPIALYRLPDGIFATHNICTHQRASLADGYIEKDCIECPLHQGRFEIRTGRAVDGPVEIDLQVFPVKVDGEEVYVLVESVQEVEETDRAKSHNARAQYEVNFIRTPRASGDPCVVVIGAGQAGARVSESARRNDFQGHIALIGNESHDPYERPPLSKEVLAGSTSANDLRILSQERAAKLGVDLLVGVSAEALDVATGSIKLSNGESIRFQALVLAMGARPRRLSVPGADLQNIFYLRTLDDALLFRRALLDISRLTVVGSGFIGLEVASVAIDMGIDVTIVEQSSRILGRAMHAEPAMFLQRRAEEAGVEFIFNTTVVNFLGRSHVNAVTLDNGLTIETEGVLVAIGVTPNVELAAAAGICVDDGIVVDKFGGTSIDNIYAVGDVAAFQSPYWEGHRRPESWHAAEAFAKTVGRTLAGCSTPFEAPPWFWTDQFGLNVQMIGATSADCGAEIYKREGKHAFSYALLQDGALRGMVSINAPQHIREARQVLRGGMPNRLLTRSQH